MDEMRDIIVLTCLLSEHKLRATITSDQAMTIFLYAMVTFW